MSNPALRRARARRRRWEPVLYIAPAFIALALIVAVPMASALGTSFLNASLLRPGQDTFAGLANYAALLRDPTFWTVLGRTALWALACLVVQGGLGLVLATVLSKRLRARGLVRTVLIVPWVVPGVLVALIWRFLLDPTAGPLNQALRGLGLWDNPPVWLAEPRFALPVLVLISAWKWTPFAAVVLLAGMQQVPHELHEAAAIDGAGSWRRFVHVTLPGIRPSLALVALTTISGAINNFNGIWLFTKGGPLGSTEILTTYAYRTAFLQFDFGRGAAVSVVIFAIMMVLATAYLFVVEPRRR